MPSLPNHSLQYICDCINASILQQFGARLWEQHVRVFGQKLLAGREGAEAPASIR